MKLSELEVIVTKLRVTAKDTDPEIRAVHEVHGKYDLSPKVHVTKQDSSVDQVFYLQLERRQ